MEMISARGVLLYIVVLVLPFRPLLISLCKCYCVAVGCTLARQVLPAQSLNSMHDRREITSSIKEKLTIPGRL